MFKVTIKESENGSIVSTEKFLNQNHAETWSEDQKLITGYFYLIEDITEEYNLAKQKQEAQSYLNSTDWYITRFVERGVAVPQEITQARLAAVATLNL